MTHKQQIPCSVLLQLSHVPVCLQTHCSLYTCVLEHFGGFQIRLLQIGMREHSAKNTFQNRAWCSGSGGVVVQERVEWLGHVEARFLSPGDLTSHAVAVAVVVRADPAVGQSLPVRCLSLLALMVPSSLLASGK